ncbi:MAG: hypothetical protein A2175_01450 [Candidatus Nealsonbacteria bacterium RBG_13_42_11]|uniref:Uncharacterized protein n=1 Tax=Candidatus Nealsonbacteria bacterium RBG_13_42_11 TaxID=1801663 RepID=A0A1G2DZK9_9BACT|nr:MAG: hypothetical protein A2175_01450 [Candidatus Nealsonbacteria bacterium RBG_13_42_11]
METVGLNYFKNGIFQEITDVVRLEIAPALFVSVIICVVAPGKPVLIHTVPVRFLRVKIRVTRVPIIASAVITLV